MKIMDQSVQDDCIIETVTISAKKKMKQAQLPFQMQSAMESPNSLRNKKRKLTSPSVELKSPKIVKISNKDIAKDSKKNDLKDSDVIHESVECIEIVDDVETENVKENTLSNTVTTPITSKRRRSSVGRKKHEGKDKIKSSPLIKFLRKTEKEMGSSDENHKTSQKDEKNDAINKDSDAKVEEKEQKSEGDSSNKEEDVSVIENISINQDSDCDIEVVSSDVEEKDEQRNSDDNLEESIQEQSPSICRTPKADKVRQKKLTPKQQERKQAIEKQKEERKKLKMEKEKQLEEEREKKRRLKEEQRREKEVKNKAEKEQKMMEKKMKELKKQMEIEQKQKEKQAKEEERRKRDEAKEEEKRRKEEAERKKQKAASNFTSFFVAKKQEKSVEEESSTKTQNFMPFEVKADMKIAPVCRRELNNREKSSLDEKYNEGQAQLSDLYLSEIRKKKIVPRKSGKTWPLEVKDDIFLLDEENDGSSNIVKQKVDIENQRIKLLQFSENRRPPYWGTWRKRSRNINPRRPFAKDSELFDYEVDSDEEWEEEEPGESLHGSDDEKDEENPEENEYDVDNEFMVPHGYLSDEEVRAVEDDKEDMSPETQKVKLKLLGEQFESERNTKTSKLKPKIIGCVWRGPENTFSETVPQRTRDFLSAREAWVRQIPVTLPTASENESVTECSTPTQQQPTKTVSSGPKKTRVPEEAIPDLIRLVHGNTHNKRFLVKEFITFWHKKTEGSQRLLSKASVLNKIMETSKWTSCPDEGPMHLKCCWYVHEKTRKEYDLEDLTMPNRWSYTLTPTRRSDFAEIPEKSQKEEKEEKKSVPLITQFTKKITQEEMKKQLTASPVHSTPTKNSVQSTPTKKSAQRAPKRATLISVARGEQISKVSKDNLSKCIEIKKTKGNDDVSKIDKVDDEETNKEELSGSKQDS